MTGLSTATLTLPWPHKDLSPNARVHWRALASAKKRAKSDAFYLTRQAVPRIAAERVVVRYTFFPPHNRGYDLDNLVARMKAPADGIALAIGVDDSKWEIVVAPKGPVERNGKVVVELEWSA